MAPARAAFAVRCLLRGFPQKRFVKSTAESNIAHALDAGLRLCLIRAPLARASDPHRYA